MEIPDIIVVNKADHPLTDTMVREIRGVLSLGRRTAAAGACRSSRPRPHAARACDELVEQARRAPRLHRGGGHAVRAPPAQPAQRGARRSAPPPAPPASRRALERGPALPGAARRGRRAPARPGQRRDRDPRALRRAERLAQRVARRRPRAPARRAAARRAAPASAPRAARASSRVSATPTSASAMPMRAHAPQRPGAQRRRAGQRDRERLAGDAAVRATGSRKTP